MIVAFLALLLLSVPPATAAEPSCGLCHRETSRGVHAALACADCHGGGPEQRAAELASTGMALRCQQCHEGTLGVLHGPMATRGAERAFVARSWGRADPDFYSKNCAACHVRDCLDCHGLDGHAIVRPEKEDCHTCHRGYYVGADYYGHAPREDAQRYQRGPGYGGEHYLKMSPDVHAQAGMVCGDCHGMAGLAAGKRADKGCRDCHEPDPTIIEHGIAAHLEKLECYACHSGWAAQEYGTFFIRFTNGVIPDYFRLRRDQTAPDYLRSAYLRLQDLPPLGLNERGLVSPIRPQFLAYFSEIDGETTRGEDNRRLAAEWKAFFPHTVQRGTPLCDACHDRPARFLLEKPEDRVYLPDKDGLGLVSFWNQAGQKVVNGAFVDQARYERLSRRDATYVKAYVEKWKRLAESVENSSSP